jgi:energy-coupling factor transporter ATP-binding protein EcfA2
MTAHDLRIEGLTFSYPAFGGEPRRQLFEGLSFHLDAGETGVLLGPADAGKTTLARILVGLVPRFTGGRLEGDIRCGPCDIRSTRPYDLIETVGLVFQDSDGQMFTTRCDTELAFALESLGTPRVEIAERIAAGLELVGLSEFRARNPSTLSGGEKKRLLVGCLAAINPSVWILDESIEELDADWKPRILDAVRARGRTLLMFDSRWTPLLAERGDRFGLLAGGTISAASARPVSAQLRAGLLAEGIAVQDRHVSAPRARPTGLPFLKAEGIRFAFPEPDGFALDIDVLEVEKGEVTALVGANGSGKSTLGRVLCGLLPPQKGVLSVNDGGGFHPSTTAELNRRVGYLFQNPDHQIYLPTVQEELGLGLKMRGVDCSRSRRS